MTLGEFRKQTEHLSDNLDMVLEQTNDEFRYSQAEKAEVQPVRYEDPGMSRKEWPTVDCLVITDEL